MGKSAEPGVNRRCGCDDVGRLAVRADLVLMRKDLVGVVNRFRSSLCR